jgi:hypothetical protein
MLCENVADSVELTSQQIDDLRDIAQLCPYSEGPGVYMARSLLLSVDTIPQNYYNYCEIDNEPGTGKWEGENVTSNATTPAAPDVPLFILNIE